MAIEFLPASSATFDSTTSSKPIELDEDGWPKTQMGRIMKSLNTQYQQEESDPAKRIQIIPVL